MFNFKKNGVHVEKYRVLWMCLSALLLIPGIIAMIYSMITYPTHSPMKVGIDYTGGTILQYGVPEAVSSDDLAKTREDLDNIGVTNTYLQVLNVNPTTENNNIKSIISIRTKFIDEGSDLSNQISTIQKCRTCSSFISWSNSWKRIIQNVYHCIVISNCWYDCLYFI